ncbi:MAG: CsbD family protein [Sphingomonadales bacterium]|jgi:uncharacterized protein YjbJ (UPF0337 family)
MAVNKKTVAGAANQAIGSAKAAAGDLLDDTSLEVSGKVQNAKGKVQTAAGKTEAAVEKAIKSLEKSR